MLWDPCRIHASEHPVAVIQSANLSEKATTTSTAKRGLCPVGRTRTLPVWVGSPRPADAPTSRCVLRQLLLVLLYSDVRETDKTLLQALGRDGLTA